jgi:hypothetical protein
MITFMEQGYFPSQVGSVLNTSVGSKAVRRRVSMHSISKTISDRSLEEKGKKAANWCDTSRHNAAPTGRLTRAPYYKHRQKSH